MKIKIKRTLWPSIFTLLNMFLGYMSIIQIFAAHHIHESGGDIELYHEKIILAGWLIFIATILDGLDGKVARLVHGSSDFGVEMDSLADLLSFVIAPSLMIYFLYSSDISVYGSIIAFTYVIFGSIRLARFNVLAHRESLGHFIGLPSPMAAITIVGIPMFFISFTGDIGRSKIILPFVIIIGFLMVSQITFKKFSSLSLRKASGLRGDTIFFIVNLILIIIYKEKVVFPLAIISIIANILLYWRKRNLGSDDYIEIEEEDKNTGGENG
ncbi:MAG: CDP-diacylglycerol--serine O-phosphatidyltransferase [Candidatus Marinimicrobia bacterium]|nr:CDP-diacylglycerol--serine O-phosphatidyltransferase [Candidatus Neomarinimicrobiota bacterium]